jgi:anhydro-N-acetylmuramic acid kinase
MSPETAKGESGLFIGLMSGTSMDSIDAALVSLNGGQLELLETIEQHLPTTLRQQLLDLCQPGNNEIDRLGHADRALGKAFANAVNALLEKSGKKAFEIKAIGSHGQTIRHRPNGKYGFSLQIADPNTIAFETDIMTVADFRRKDIAAHGQGAPLAPAFHNAAFRSNQHNRVIINIGGMANITYLSSNGDTLGFDTGPGNILMDGWIQENMQLRYDQDGQWAASGSVAQTLLEQLLRHPFLSQVRPKSTGREDFNLGWLKEILSNFELPAADIQATLLELTAQSINNEINNLPTTVDEIYVCGGGAYNGPLMQRLNTLSSPVAVSNTAQLGIPAKWVEACAFAWLAQQTLTRRPSNLSRVTGADKEVILGAIYPV